MLHFDVDVKLTVDGAMLYYLCEGKCGGSANEPCPFCHATKSKTKCSIGFVFQLVHFDNSVTAYGDVAKKYRINLEQLVDMNTEENEEKYQPLTVEAKGDTQASKHKPTRHLPLPMQKLQGKHIPLPMQKLLRMESQLD